MKLQTVLMAFLALGLSIGNAYAQEKRIPKQEKVATNIKHDMTQLSSQIEGYIELNVKCLNEDEKSKIDSCTVVGLNTLADKGSYVAQHALGNYYEEKGDKAKAIEFYHAALKNPNLSDSYKPEVQKDLDRAKR